MNLRSGAAGPEVASNASPAATRQKIEWVKEAAGARFDQIELNTLIGFAIITDDKSSTLDTMAPIFGITSEEAAHVPLALIGTLEEMEEELEWRRAEYGISYFAHRGRLLAGPRPARARGWPGRERPLAPRRARGRRPATTARCAGTRSSPSTSAAEGEAAAPLLVLHGFPTSSLDFHAVLEPLRRHRRVLLFDFLGYGLSDKPDQAYTMGGQADVAMAYVADLGIERSGAVEPRHGRHGRRRAPGAPGRGDLDVEITRRVLTNGSIYIEMAHLSDGQQFLLAPARREVRRPRPATATGIQPASGDFSDKSRVDDDELGAMWECIAGPRRLQRMLPRLIRYIEERRRNQGRFTGAIETHPSPLDIVWGRTIRSRWSRWPTAWCAARPGAGLESAR